MILREVTLEEVLNNREKRVLRQTELIRLYERPVLSCTLNIPGAMKQTPLIDFVFRQTMDDVRDAFKEAILVEERQCERTGPEAFFVMDASAQDIKEIAVALENRDPIGRLLDLDVIDKDGRKRSRPESRPCLICGGPVTVCSRSRAHGLAAVERAAWGRMTGYALERLADLAVDALTREAVLTPKPGLVDENNSGAHRDMDLGLLLASAAALRPYFRFCADFGFHGGREIAKLVRAGLEAEKTMLSHTGGVNTHKGALYAMGLFLSATAIYFIQGGDPFEISSRLAGAQSMVSQRDPGSHGGIVRKKYQAGGAREEAINGFPTARKGAEALIHSRGDGLYALLKILEEIRDTNLLYRGGARALDWVHGQARQILSLDPATRKDALLRMDQECIRLNISPGGAADMLALAFLIKETAPDLFQS